MNDYQTYRKSAIRYWEIRRIYYNLALIFPTILGYSLIVGIEVGIDDKESLNPEAAIVMFIFSVIGANICYSFVYAFEFIFGSDDLDSTWLRTGRTMLFVCGTLFSMLLAFMVAGNIARLEYSSF